MHQKGILGCENNFPLIAVLLHIEIKAFKRRHLFTQFHNIRPLFLSQPAVARIRPLCADRCSPHHQESHFLRRYYFLLFLHYAHSYQNRERKFVFFQKGTDNVLEKGLREHAVYVFDTFETTRDSFFD